MVKFIKATGLKNFRKGHPWRDNCAIYECECGVTYEAVVSIVNQGKSSQHCKQCSVINKSNKLKTAKTKHGMSGTKLKSVFSSMKERCNPKNKELFPNYAGRGITVCDKWLKDSSKFFDWALSNGYVVGLTIERVNNNKGYSPKNCKWVTRTVQAQNKRRGVRDLPIGVTYHGRITKRFRVQISSDKKRYSLGIFKTKYESAKAYNDFVDKHKTKHTKNELKDWINE